MRSRRGQDNLTKGAYVWRYTRPDDKVGSDRALRGAINSGRGSAPSRDLTRPQCTENRGVKDSTWRDESPRRIDTGGDTRTDPAWILVMRGLGLTWEELPS